MAKIDLHQQVTDRVYALMQEHGTDWLKPFSGTASQGGILPLNAETLKPYNGINVFLLWSQPYSDQRWGTFKTWQRLGGQVAKGEKGTRIVYWKILESKTQKTAAGKPKTFPMLKYFTVFNAEQLTAETRPEPLAPIVIEKTEAGEIPAADAYLKATGARIQHSTEGRAYYVPALDVIHLPHRDQFRGGDDGDPTAAYYATAFHELTHWTGHASRLDREGITGGGYRHDKRYAFEELVAELGAAILCATQGVSPEPRADHAKYLNSWMRLLQDEPKAITAAAGAASKAVTYCDGLQPDAEQEEAA